MLQLPLFAHESDWRPPELGLLPNWKGARRIGLDIETCDPNLKKTGPSVRTGGFICGVSFALEGDVHPKTGKQRGYYLPLRHFGGNNVPLDGALFYLKSQAREFKGELVGANFQYDLDYLAEEGILFPNVHRFRDVQIADPLLYEMHNSYSLDAIAKRYGYEGKSERLLKLAARDYGVDPKGEMWKLPARFVGPYAEDDAVLAVQIIAKQEVELERQDLMGVYDLESKLQPILLGMRRQGVRIDLDKLAHIEAVMQEAEMADAKELTRRTGIIVGLGDINKKKTTAAILDKIGVRFKKTATGQPKIDKELLDSVDHPVADMILHARKVNKIRTTFCKSVRDHQVDGRIHATFNQLRSTGKHGSESGAKYGRLSCSNPNMQQQPARDPEYAALWRSIYVPDHEEQLWCSADYSQQEPRMVVHFSELMGLHGSRAAGEAYRNDPSTDNHSMMTRMIWPELAEMHDKDPEFVKARKQAKAIFLGLCLGRGTALLTDRGMVAIEKVTSAHRLWDGQEFITHGGVVPTGRKSCIKIAGTWMTETHEVLTPHGWYQAQDLSTLNLSPAQLMDSSRLSLSATDLGAESSPSSVVAPVVDQLLRCATIWSVENRHAVLSVVKQRLLRHAHTTQGLVPIVSDFLTAFVASLADALRDPTHAMGAEASKSMPLGSLTELCFSATCLRFPDMMTQLLTLTGSTTTGTTSPATSDSLRTPRTCVIETYDVIDAGPRNRFCLATGMVVSNCYGMGSGKLAANLGMSTETRKRRNGSTYLVAGPEGRRLLNLFEQRVPYVKRLAERAEKRAKAKGFIRTLSGRKCRFPLQADGSFDWTFKALNRLIQGSSADQTKMAMVAVAEAGLPMQLQVHDEVCSSVDSIEVAREIAHTMETCLPLGVPSKVDIEIGPNWGESKEVD